MKNLKQLKSIIVLALILLSSIIVKAEVKLEASGQVKDKNSKEGLMFCTVVVYNLKDSLITDGSTDEKGFFNLAVQKGDYKFLFTYTGYKSDTVKITIDSENTFLGIIKLEPVETELGEVIVEASVHQNKIDKEVQLVTKTMRVGASNTSDLLDKVQGLTFDRYKKTIKVDGSDKVILLVNGLEKDQDYIKNLSPDRLKEIEIIRSPSGRYALEGYNAVINIILKTDYKGSEIYISEDAYVDLDAKETSYMLPVNYFSASFNYTYDKLNFYAKFKNEHNEFHLLNRVTKQYSDVLSVENNPFNEEDNQNIYRLTNNYTIGFDYYLNPKHTLSFESNIQGFPNSSDRYDELYNVIQKNNGIIENYVSNISSESASQNIKNSLFYVYRINKNNKISSDFTYTSYTDNYINSYSESFFLDRIETGTNSKYDTKFNVEFEHVLNDKSSITAGYGNIWRKLENSYTAGTEIMPYNEFLNDTNTYNSTEQRHSLYAYYALQMTKKMSLKIGAAAENSHPKVGDLENTYTIYRPHLDFKVDVHDLLKLKLKYRADSKYPRISQAVPFSHIIDRYTSEQGNPFLKPELTHKISLDVFAVMGALTFEPYYKFSDNKIIRAITAQNNGMYEYNYYNGKDFSEKGIKGNLTIPLLDQSLIIQSGFDYSVSSMSFNDEVNSFDDWTMNSQIVYINEKYDFIGLLTYQKNIKKYITAQGYNNTGLDFWMLYVQKSFMKKRLTVNLGYMLPVNFGVSYEQGIYTEAGVYKENFTNDISLLKNVVMVGIKYRFNKGKDVKKNDKDIKIDIEKNSKGIF